MAKKWSYLPSLGGLETIKPIDKIGDTSASECQNIDMSEEGLLQSSRGYRSFANEISGGGECLKGFAFRKALGTARDILLKNTDDGSNSYLYWLNESNPDTTDGKWELLLTGLTQGAVMGFASANGDENEYQNRLIMCNGEDEFTVWNGATGLVDSVTSDSIIIKETIQNEGFDTDSGSIMVDGTEYAYTGTSGSTFTGVTPDPTIQNPVENSGVAQSPDDTSYAESSYTASTISFDATNQEINDSANGFGVLGSPDTIRVIGADEFENNYIFPVESITDSKITLGATSQPIVAESAGEEIQIFTGNPKGNILLLDQRKLFLTNGKDNKVFYSHSGDATTFFPTDSGLGSAGFLTILENSGDITLLEATSKADTILIHKKNGIMAYTRSTDGTNTLESFENLADAEGSGATNLKASTRYNQSSYFITKVNGLNQLSKAINDSSLNIDSFSEKILPTVKQYDFSNGTVAYFPQKRCIYVACKNDSSRVANNKQIAFYLRKNNSGQWVTDISIDDFNINDYAVLNDELYAFSSVNQNVYKMFDTKSRNGSAISHRWTSKEFTMDAPANSKKTDMMFVEGLLGERTKLKITILYGPYGLDGTKSIVIDQDSKSVYDSKISTLGTDVLGALPIGSRSEDVLDSYFFSIPISLASELDSSRIKVRVETYYDEDTVDDSYWAMINLGFNPVLGGVMQTRILNIND